MPMVRNSGTDRDFQHHRNNNFNIGLPQSKGQAIAGAMVAKFILPLVPNLGTDRGLRPIDAGYVLESNLSSRCRKLSGPHKRSGCIYERLKTDHLTGGNYYEEYEKFWNRNRQADKRP